MKAILITFAAFAALAYGGATVSLECISTNLKKYNGSWKFDLDARSTVHEYSRDTTWYYTDENGLEVKAICVGANGKAAMVNDNDFYALRTDRTRTNILCVELITHSDYGTCSAYRNGEELGSHVCKTTVTPDEN